MSLRTIRFLLHHPLSKKNKPLAFYRFLSWQIRSRLIRKPVAYRFVSESKLLVYPGMTGATGNVYAGLHEFEDMAFVLHALRAEDLFIDVGANIGSYTVLAGSAVGSSCIAVEPVPSTFNHLIENIDLNSLKAKVKSLNIGFGKENDMLRFSIGEDSKNHVMSSIETCENYIDVEVKCLDNTLSDKYPTIVKIDVEGWETNVIRGAEKLLSRQKPLAILIEFGEGKRYGFDEQELYQKISNFGFERATYSPFERNLQLSEERDLRPGNILFVKQIEYFQQRVSSAPKYKVLNIEI